jgi:outer membrane receptor protein involved in Fe transport
VKHRPNARWCVLHGWNVALLPLLPLLLAGIVRAQSVPPLPVPPVQATAVSDPDLSRAPASSIAEVVVDVARPISAASSLSVRDRDFALRPIGSVQDILRVTPGLVMVQHSGGGKANQYFLRGFDADHGTDVALSIDGVPINMVSHAHGQGFSDTNFIIAEVVERVEITKGPYFAAQGDFATAGSVNLVSRDAFEHSSLGFGVSGSPGQGGPGYRGVAIASPEFESTRAIFAAEIGRSEGPFDNPEHWDKYKLFNKVHVTLSDKTTVNLGELSYASNWNGSGQIPDRAVQQGLISRWGAIDPDEGGNTARHQMFAQLQSRPSDNSSVEALAYLGTYRFNLFSNFTLFLNNTETGDEIEQVDRRTFFGGRVKYRIVHDLSGLRFDTTIGADTRSDDIHNELWNTSARVPQELVVSTDTHQTFLGAFLNEEITPVRWLRLNLGGRADLLSFAVDDRKTPVQELGALSPASGVGADHQFSPKASLIVTPVESDSLNLDLYLNYGSGFHSNDVRGAFTQVAVSPLTRAKGEEFGVRARLWQRWDLAAALWRLDLAQETVWVGDEGTTEVGDATRRQGIELETRYEFTSWLAADLDLTFTQSELRRNAGNGNGLALAPKRTWSGGVSARHSLGPGTGRAGIRFYGIGDRPASDDGVIVAPGFTQFDAHVGYRHRWFDIALDVENLLDGRYRSAQFDTVSRLPNEPLVGAPLPAGFSCGRRGRLASAPDGSPGSDAFYGCEEVNYTPAYPLAARVLTTLYLD